MKHGAFIIPPHGLRRVWRVEYYRHGNYIGKRHYRRYRLARSEQHLYNTTTRGEQ